ncbi:MAG: DinB family protein [Chloroflexi bacterium]|nr:MAG: DinB family protein [Chloroflexota bacterium]TMF36331.1 MAG: DinB family protein [Chloroflexota bacterium]
MTGTMNEAGARALAESLGKLFGELHENFREQVRGLDPGTLNWSPLPKANSIAVLVTHAIGSELEMIRSVRSIPTSRDRDSEFKAESDAERLLEMIDAAARELDEHIAALTPADLTELRPRGDRPPRPGIEWLVSNYGHAREHLAQIELTKQLYDSRT